MSLAYGPPLRIPIPKIPVIPQLIAGRLIEDAKRLITTYSIQGNCLNELTTAFIVNLLLFLAIWPLSITMNMSRESGVLFVQFVTPYTRPTDLLASLIGHTKLNATPKLNATFAKHFLDLLITPHNNK